ncbi:MAG: tetratricopeptide repeat protein, partial [Cyanobacteria bacterium P01_C01_bin.72]
QVIKIQPDYTDAYINRGLIYATLGEYEKAIVDYDQAIQLQPDYANAYYNRGNTYKKLEDKQAAIRDYQKAAELYQSQGKTDYYQNAINQVNRLQ